MEGKFLVIEGADGTGKSTQAQMLASYLEDRGTPVIAVREPGGTKVGEKIRAILRDPALAGMSARTEMFLYMASRAQLVKEVIRPALAEGKTVVADRFLLSTVVYQGIAGGLGMETVLEAGKVATGDLKPSLTIIIDLEDKKRMARKGIELDGAQADLFDEPPDREELKGIEFHRKVRDAYLEFARKDGSLVVIDGGGTPEQVHERVVKAVENALR
jgi:dTMP kinase